MLQNGEQQQGHRACAGVEKDAKARGYLLIARKALDHQKQLVRPIVRYHNIQTACPRPETDGFTPCPDRINRNARTYQITLANGTTQNFTTDDPGRLLLTGQIADLGMLDITNLHGISRTAPYFHNNSAATMEEVVDHYIASLSVQPG